MNIASAPTSGDEWLMLAEKEANLGIIQRIEAPGRRTTFCERFNRFTPGIMLRIFALCKFAAVLYISTNRVWNEKEMPFVVIMLCLNAGFLFSATFQDFCTLILSWIITCVMLIINSILLIIVPIFVTSFFASDSARQVSIPREWRVFGDYINYRSREERLLKKGIEYGLSVEIVLVILVFVYGIQFALLNATLNAKLDQLKYKRQEREKRNSVYLI